MQLIGDFSLPRPERQEAQKASVHQRGGRLVMLAARQVLWWPFSIDKHAQSDRACTQTLKAWSLRDKVVASRAIAFNPKKTDKRWLSQLASNLWALLPVSLKP